MFFLSLEEEIRVLLSSLFTKENRKEKIFEEFCNIEDVQFYWLIVNDDVDKEDQDVHSELLKQVVELFVTIRGFSYASACLG